MDDSTSTMSMLATAAREAPRGPRLWVVHHPEPRHLGASIAVPSEGLVLGRHGPALGGALIDGKLSRRHARITPGPGGLTVEDLGSRNGTTVDGQPVQRGFLAPDGVLGLGRLRLLLADGPEAPPPQHPRVLGVSPAVSALLRQLELVAVTDLTVLLLGAPGVGKELFARELHTASGRRGEFVALNCAGVSDPVLHSELFGHVRGAFSGADRRRDGLVARAADGTLLLDEIGDASTPFQTSLLRLLQERTYRPVGADRDLRADCRFVAATNQDLEAAVAAGHFRLDLQGRLSAFVLRIPPLAERRMDIAVLARRFAVDRAGPGVRFTPELSEALVRAAWPGNVRQLQAVITRLAVETPAGPWSIPADGLGVARAMEATRAPAPAKTNRARKSRPDPAALGALLVELDGNIRLTAAELGVGRNTLYRWIKDAGIDLEALRQDD